MGSIEESEVSPVETFETLRESEHGPYIVKEEPLGTLRHIRIVTIGAGASGLNMIRSLRLHTSNFTHTVYEKNASIGGTWHENRYPGCKCDIPSHNYQFAHTPNPGWTALFSEGAEIQSYLEHLCEKHDLRKDVKLEHAVMHASWDEGAGEWTLKVRNEKTGEVFKDHCNFLLNATGVLNEWKWPDINGLSSFKGDVIHSANWPKEFDYREKRVAVIGNGSSGVQIVPALQPDVKELVHFIRSPTWIAPPAVQSMANSPIGSMLATIKFDEHENFAPEQIEEFKKYPEKYRQFVKAVEMVVNSRFKSTVTSTEEAQMTRKILTAYMTAALNNDPRLTKALIPSFPVGCRRLTPGVGYLASLTKPNVEVITEPISQVVAEGIKLADGRVIQLDAIVCATGFDVSFVPRFPIVAQNGNLQDLWKKNVPEAYMSCLVPGMPNYFVFLGPNSPVGHGSILTITEHLARYVVKVIRKCQLEHYTSMRPLPSAVQDFSEHIATFMPRTAWAGSCSSWFKGGKKDGPVTALHPGSRIHWFHMLENPRWEDFEWRGSGRNRFSYLGNGFSTKEAPGQNSTWYLDEPDKL